MCDVTVSNCSEPLTVETGKMGDIVPPFGGALQPDFKDIASTVQKFVATATAPDTTRADLVSLGDLGNPNTPDQTVDFRDIAACVSGFLQLDYPYAVPSCP